MSLKLMWDNFLSSGISETEVTYANLTQIKFLNFLGFLGSSVSIFMALFHFYIKDDFFGTLYHFIGVLLAWGDLIYLRFSKNYKNASSIMILIVIYIGVFFLIDGGVEAEGLTFLPFLPIVAYYLKGSYEGVKWSILFGLIIIISTFLINFEIISSPYSTNTLINTMPIYMLFSTFLYFYEIRKEKNTKIIENKRNDLKILNKTLEAKVLNKTKELQNITDNMSEGLFVIDLEAKVKYLNPTAEKIFGYKKDEVLNQNIDLLINPRDENGVALTIENCPILNVTQNKKTYKTDDLIFATKEANDINVSLSANPLINNNEIVGAIIVFHDITEAKKQEKELKAIYEGLVDGIILANANTKRVIKVNSSACKMFGYTQDEFYQKSIFEIHPKNKLEFIEKKFQEAVDFETYYADEIPCIKKDGIIFYSDIASSHINFRGVDTIIGFFRDASERQKSKEALRIKQMEIEKLNTTLEERVKEEIAKNREKEHILIQQSKMASMGEMIGNIAHQWRQPLNTIGIILQKLQYSYKREKLSDEVMDKSVEKGMLLVNKMSTTIDDFRNFFKPNKEKVIFNIRENILNAFNVLEASFKFNNINVEFLINENISIYGYPNEFSQVLLNILNNAKDVFIERNILNKKILIKAQKYDSFIEITILDNAGGIKKEIIDRIFEPYFSTKENSKGTGIGLYMSKMIIEENMNGKLFVKNYNGGAKFNMILPISDKNFK